MAPGAQMCGSECVVMRTNVERGGCRGDRRSKKNGRGSPSAGSDNPLSFADKPRAPKTIKGEQRTHYTANGLQLTYVDASLFRGLKDKCEF